MVFRYSEASSVPEQWEPLIEFDDDTAPIMVLKTVGGEIALEAMERARTMPDAAVTAWCMEVCLGEDGWKRLRALKGLPRPVYTNIMQMCRKKVFGDLEDEGKA